MISLTYLFIFQAPVRQYKKIREPDYRESTVVAPFLVPSPTVFSASTCVKIMELYSVLVTGANRGIGLAFVRQMLELRPPPKHLFATYRSDQNLQVRKRFVLHKYLLFLVNLLIFKTPIID